MVTEGAAETLVAHRAEPGKDIWVFGGGYLFRSLAEERLVDSLEIAVAPILLGGGIPLLRPPPPRIKLVLRAQKIYKERHRVVRRCHYVDARSGPYDFPESLPFDPLSCIMANSGVEVRRAGKSPVRKGQSV